MIQVYPCICRRERYHVLLHVQVRAESLHPQKSGELAICHVASVEITSFSDVIFIQPGIIGSGVWLGLV